MKKKFLSAVAIIAFGFAAQAQEDEVIFGVKAGVNFSNFDYEGSDGNTGLYAGALADFPVSGNFHVQGELLYSLEGGNDNRLDYLRIPVMAKYYVIENLSLLAGPQFGFKVGGEEPFKNNVKSFDFGIAAGAAYELESGFFFEARYNLGLTKINDYQSQFVPQVPDGNPLPDFKNTNFQIGIGLRY